MKKISLFMLFLLCNKIIYAGPQKVLNRGYILSDTGQKCWYKQEYQDQVIYFTKHATQNIGIMTFDDVSCLKDSGLGLNANKLMISNLVSRWYSHSDAQFQNHPLDMHDPQGAQIKGKCIQSKTYPNISIAIDYHIKKDSIFKVVHGSNPLGCK